MAIIYSYPPNSNILPTDILICTSTVLVSGKPKNQTKSISIQNLTSYVNTSSTNNLNQVLTNGNYSLLFANVGQLGLFDTSESDYALLKISDSEFIFEDVNGIATSQSRRGITLLGDGVHYGSIYLPPYTTSHQYDLPDNTGTIALTSDLSAYVPYTGATQAVNLGVNNLTANSFIKAGGTNREFLMANGSVSTNGTLYSIASTTYQVAAGALQSISSAIPSGIFTNGNLLKLNAVITTTATSVAIATIEFYINSAATISGATLIGRYNGPIGNQYIPIDRFFWVSGTTIYGRDFTASASTSTSNSTFAINSVAIPATQFYIIAQVTTTSTDRAAISSFHVEKS